MCVDNISSSNHYNNNDDYYYNNNNNNNNNHSYYNNYNSRCDSKRCSQLSKLSRQVPEQLQEDEDHTRQFWKSAGPRVQSLRCRVPCLLSLWLPEDPRRRRDNLDGEDLRLLLAGQDHQQHQRRQAWLQDQCQRERNRLECLLAWSDSRCLWTAFCLGISS